jgi:nucleotide-binding universal stress UspA family protein
MLDILVPIDGSEHSLRALDEAAADASRCKEPLRAHLVNVQLPLLGVHVKTFISRDTLEDYYREQGHEALKAARERAAAAGLEHDVHIGVGDPAAVIVQYAADKKCARIYMGTRGLGSVVGMLLGSVATKAVHLSKVPVLLVK